MTARGPAIRRSMIPASWLFATVAAVLATIPMLLAQATFQASNDRQATATQALVEAARSGDLPAIASLIEAGANVNGTASGDDTPLMAAARGGRLPAVRLLLDRGGNPNLTGAGKGTPLTVAAREGHTSVVELLLDRGASINDDAEGDGTALIVASAAGRADTVRLLVARSADLNVRTRDSVVVRREQVVYDSLGSRRVVPVRSVQVQVRSALAAARRGGHDDVAAFLVSVGAEE
jgi:hypothetical protein